MLATAVPKVAMAQFWLYNYLIQTSDNFFHDFLMQTLALLLVLRYFTQMINDLIYYESFSIQVAIP